MVFEYILRQNQIDPAADLSIDQSIDFGSTAAAFSGGKGDFSVEFEPSATALEAEGAGYVVASLGVDSGYVPYTAFSAKSSYIEEHPDIIQKFTNALQKGMDYTLAHTPEEIAKAIAPQFKETEMETLTSIVRAGNPQMGIIMLTARTQEMDKVSGLMTGADDYVTKPFSRAVSSAGEKGLVDRKSTRLNSSHWS